MTRAAPSSASDATAEYAYLLEVVFWDGSSEQPIRLTTAGQDLEVDADGDGTAELYTSAEGYLGWGGATEASDKRSQGTRLELSGVDTTVIAALLQNDFRGRRIRIWRAELNPSTGAIDDTMLLHRGLQLAPWEIDENPPKEGSNEPGTATITTRSVSRLVAMQGSQPVRANERSHNAMLARAGESTGDTGCQYVGQIKGRIFWGQEAPDPAADGSGGGGSAGTGGSGGTDRDDERTAV